MAMGLELIFLECERIFSSTDTIYIYKHVVSQSFQNTLHIRVGT
jgi:hypothetical protein